MLKGSVTPTRCLVVLVAASCVLLFALVPRYDLLDDPQNAKVLAPRQNGGGLFGGGFGETTTSAGTTGNTATTSQTSTSTATTSSTSTSTTSSTTQTSTTTTQATTQSTTSSTTSTTSPTDAKTSTTSADRSNTTPTTTASPVTTAVLTTQSDGELVTVVITSTPSASSPTSSSAADNSDDDGNSSRNKTSTIIGLSVAGGVALIGLVGFLVWKFTRKRFGDDDFDDVDAIKWPDLNNHGASTVPAATSARGLEAGSPSDISRAPSRMNDGYAASVAASSTTELYPAAADPYAVPPLPHLNPNQPYRDDPGAYAAAYYDPYRGPVPQTFNDTESVHGAGGEAIPMTQLAPAANRARSPAPAMAYDMTGRASPQPSMMGRASPGPQFAYGRASPGPQVGLGLGGPAGVPMAGRASPGPQMAYEAGPR